ncbi:hypothetical protein ACIOK3_31155, partial [Streptomyces mirabilis]
MREVDQLDAEGGEILRAEVREILGVRADRAAFEPLVHNLKSGVTGGVWRVTVGDRSVVLKVLTRGKDTGGSPAGPGRSPAMPSTRGAWAPRTERRPPTARTAPTARMLSTARTAPTARMLSTARAAPTARMLSTARAAPTARMLSTARAAPTARML